MKKWRRVVLTVVVLAMCAWQATCNADECKAQHPILDPATKEEVEKLYLQLERAAYNEALVQSDASASRDNRFPQRCVEGYRDAQGALFASWAQRAQEGSGEAVCGASTSPVLGMALVAEYARLHPRPDKALALAVRVQDASDVGAAVARIARHVSPWVDMTSHMFLSVQPAAAAAEDAAAACTPPAEAPAKGRRGAAAAPSPQSIAARARALVQHVYPTVRVWVDGPAAQVAAVSAGVDALGFCHVHVASVGTDGVSVWDAAGAYHVVDIADASLAATETFVSGIAGGAHAAPDVALFRAPAALNLHDATLQLHGAGMDCYLAMGSHLVKITGQGCWSRAYADHPSVDRHVVCVRASLPTRTFLTDTRNPGVSLPSDKIMILFAVRFASVMGLLLLVVFAGRRFCSSVVRLPRRRR